jgi:flagellar biogenesis protein FliO
MGTASLAIQLWGPRLRGLLARCHRSFAERNSRRVLEVQQTATIANKATVALLSVEGDRVLVAVTNGCVQLHPLRRSPAIELRVGGTVR